MPIVFVEDFKDFADGIGSKLEGLTQTGINRSDNYCRVISFNKSPLKFIVFEEKMMRTLFGKRDEKIIDVTLAMYSGHKKYPFNEKLAMNHALKMVIQEQREAAYDILKSLYVTKFGGPCTHEYSE